MFHQRSGQSIMESNYYPGLEGVVAGETAISTIEGGLQYRGYAIEDLAEQSTFLDVAYLLLYGELPSEERLADLRAILSEAGTLPLPVVDLLKSIPESVSEMDVLRTGISALAHFDPQVDDLSSNANRSKAIRLLGQIPVIVATRQRLLQEKQVLDPNPELTFAANVLYMLTGSEPTEVEERAMDVSLILYAEHEFNASTFTARVVTSTGSDLHSSIASAVGALKSPLHGGANERVMEVLQEVGSAENAQSWVDEALAAKRRIMGFGHRVYKTGDPRAKILKSYCSQLADLAGTVELEQIADTIENVVVSQKGLPPNLDWPSARLYHSLGLDIELYTPLFVISRVVGWSAHVIEQSENNRLIRPRSRYTGETGLPFKPLSGR